MPRYWKEAKIEFSRYSILRDFLTELKSVYLMRYVLRTIRIDKKFKELKLSSLRAENGQNCSLTIVAIQLAFMGKRKIFKILTSLLQNNSCLVGFLLGGDEEDAQ